MAEKALTEAQAVAKAGTTDATTGVVFPAIVRNWADDYYRALARALEVAAATNQFRAFEVEGNADAIGIRAGRMTLDGSVRTYAEEDPAVEPLTDDDTTYVWIEDDGAGGLVVGSAIDGTGWPTRPHLKVCEVTMASGAITSLLDRRGDSLLVVDGVDAAGGYSMSIETQGDTGTASTILIQGAEGVDYLRVRVCDQDAFDTATNASIAAGTNTTEVEAHTNNKDVTFKSHTDGTFRVDLTDGTPQTVTLRIGAALVSSRRRNYTATLDVTHAAP